VAEIIVKQMPGFKKDYKKLYPHEKKVVNETIKEIINDPKISEEKKGDLAGVFVYKFKFHTTEFLLGYEWCPRERVLLALGVHDFRILL
jgi:mRNA-degrading endonuclease RelE of RelBE toxin-antitoxin system